MIDHAAISEGMQDHARLVPIELGKPRPSLADLAHVVDHLLDVATMIGLLLIFLAALRINGRRWARRLRQRPGALTL